MPAIGQRRRQGTCLFAGSRYLSGGISLEGSSVIASPCILVCSIDMTTGYCFGCGRTRNEIGNWTLYSDAERSDIMKLLPARLETVVRKPRRDTKRARMARENGGRKGEA
jgi:hypothetical protein